FTQPIIEFFIIRRIKTKRLEFWLRTPIHLGQKDKAWMRCFDGGYDLRPKLLVGGRANKAAPGGRKDAPEQEHCHIAAHPVALLGNVLQRFTRELASRWGKHIQLSGIYPSGKVGVAPMCDHAARARPGKERHRVSGKGRSIPLHYAIRVGR